MGGTHGGIICLASRAVVDMSVRVYLPPHCMYIGVCTWWLCTLVRFPTLWGFLLAHLKFLVEPLHDVCVSHDRLDDGVFRERRSSESCAELVQLLLGQMTRS